MFVTVVCVLFLIELRDLKVNKNLPELDRRGKISSVLKLAVHSVPKPRIVRLPQLLCLSFTHSTKTYILTYIRKTAVY